MIEIICKNSGQKHSFPVGTTLGQVIEQVRPQTAYPILGARVNNQVEELSFTLVKPKVVEFFDLTDRDGMRMYIRSLSFVLLKAARELFPGVWPRMDQFISNGLYCELERLGRELSLQDISDLGIRMREIVERDLPFVREEVLIEDATRIFEERGYAEKICLFKTCPEFYTGLYHLADDIDYFMGYLVPSTGYLRHFDLVKYMDGMLLRLPKRKQPAKLQKIVKQDKLFDIFREYKSWVKILNVESIGRLNQTVLDGEASMLIKVAEALHERKVVKIADQIGERRGAVRLVLISGPSSSGKTTFSKRLGVQLRVLGLKPFQISLDNYFVDREHTPRDEKGDYDFETLKALDVQKLNDDLNALMLGQSVHLPRFSFQTGKRSYPEEPSQIGPDEIIILEGIHALNPELTPNVQNSLKFKIYVSPLTQLGIDGHNRIPTDDNRLLRRIIRDKQYRSYSSLETLRRWPSVRKGEARWITPFQEEADAMFNSAMIFEFSILKPYAEPLLKQVPEVEHEHAEALRLLKMLSYFTPISDKELPPTSILREFLSGSSFRY